MTTLLLCVQLPIPTPSAVIRKFDIHNLSLFFPLSRSQGKVWTSPSEDPNLTGGAQRRAWLMTREAVGADLLAQAAGALAATSILLKTDDPSFAAAALAHAQYL